MSKKGVTIIELVVVIAILILIAIIAIFNVNKPWLESQAMAYNEEFRALYTSVATIQAQYNMGNIELEEGKYYYSSTNESGEIWYSVYGMNYLNTSTDPDFISDNENIVKNLGLNGLKLSYEYKLRNTKEDKDEIQIRLLGGDYIELKGYKIRTFDELTELLNSGAI